MKHLDDDYKEGGATKEIEKQTSKIPSGFFATAALASMGLSLAYKFMNRGETALFIGQWAAPFLLLGIYNKMVKLEGHDKEDQSPN